MLQAPDQGAGNTPNDIVLDLEDVLQISVVPVCPDMVVALGISAGGVSASPPPWSKLVGPAEMSDLVTAGGVIILDIRSPKGYASGHIAGALNIPLDKLKTRLKELPRDREIVAYCRGPWCVLSFEAVAQLRDVGIEARRLENGLPEWRQAGLPVESG